MRPNGMKRSTAAPTGRLVLSACALVGFAAAASAQTDRALSIVTNEDPAQPGAFTLNFGGIGLLASSHISNTNYELSVDPIRGSARFVRYLQHVEPLILPGGFSTGDITVEVVDGSSSGSFDSLTRTFTTTEMYAVHFTGDLSAFGLTSPVLLPSTSSGLVAVDALAGGAVTMDWNGNGQLANPFDPTAPALTFSYRCAVNTLFAPDPENVVGLDLVPEVVSLQLSPGNQLRLLSRLDQSLAQIQLGSDPRAVHSLQSFIRQVDLMSPRVIAAAEADSLVNGAEEAIDLFGLLVTSNTSGRFR